MDVYIDMDMEMEIDTAISTIPSRTFDALCVIANVPALYVVKEAKIIIIMNFF